jgi:tetratricopeptide (TPR) repeat protein
VVLVALVAGLPSLRGGFLGGDDIQLVRNHVLVNHPSVAHAVRLFRPDANRDLYQPLPLLSFSANFALVRAMGLTAEAEGPRAGAWLFHLTNVLLHCANAALVWWLFARLCRGRGVAVAAGLLFAAHPLNVETIAWLNGRMMLLSTLFALASLLCFDAWACRKRWFFPVFCLLCVAGTMMSKVRIGLPVLMLVLLLQRGAWPPVRVWVLWVLAGATTASFVGLNLSLSRSMLAGGAALEGSGLVRAILALAWYLQHYVVPVGLAPWHPLPNPALWSTPGVPAALATLVVVAIVTGVSGRWSRVGLLGMLWFGATIAVTLPFFPARDLLVAERYAYLPAIGLHWIAAALVVWGIGWLHDRRGRRPAIAAGAAAVAIVVVLLGLSVRTCAFYRTSVTRALRIAACHPDAQGTWEQVANAHYHARQYEEALAAARRELTRFPDSQASSVIQIEGMSLFRLGLVDEAIEALHRAIAIDACGATAHARLAKIYEETGRLADAVSHYEQAVALAPNHNPAWTGLARVQRCRNDLDASRRAYERVIANNPYDPNAQVGLAEIAILQGDGSEAVDRLEVLVEWMPENAAAWTNLGVGYVSQGRPAVAVAAYGRALQLDAGNETAAVNLVAVLLTLGDVPRAVQVAHESLQVLPDSRPLLVACHDAYIAGQRPEAAVQLWHDAVAREPGAQELRAWYAWSVALDGRWQELAPQVAKQHVATGEGAALVTAACVLLHLHMGEPDAAVRRTQAILAATEPDPSDVADRMLRGLERFAVGHPGDPFPILVASMVLAARGDADAARAGIDLFKQTCSDKSWHDRADVLVARSASPVP